MKLQFLFSIMLIAVLGWPQVALQTVYVESYRTGPTRISEHTVIANLDTDNPTYASKIKDQDGNVRYDLQLIPQKAAENDLGIVAWRVQLIDSRRKYMGNVLVASKPPEPLSDAAKDRAWWLDPSPYAVVPLLAKRVFKIENFYCVVQVKKYHRIVPEKLPLDSMRVEIEFTDADPRNNGVRSN